MLRDLRFALHLLVKDRWYSTVAVVALALGIGVNATVFTLVNAVLIRGLPFEDSGRLYVLGSLRAADADGNGGACLVRGLQDWRGETRAFAGVAAFTGTGFNISDERGLPEQARRIARHGRTRSGCSASRRCSAATSPPADDRKGRRAGRDPRLRHLEEPLRRRPQRPRQAAAHQRPAGDDHRRDAGRHEVPDQRRAVGALHPDRSSRRSGIAAS